MPKEEQISSEKTKFKGYFDTSNFYDTLFDLFISLGYDVDEDSYRQKDSQSGEIELHWSCKKRVDKYTMFVLKADTLIVAWARKQNVVRGNTSMTLDFGDFELILSATLIRDYEGTWEKNPLIGSLLDIYDKFIYRVKYLEWQRRIKDELRSVMDDMKKFFSVQYPSSRI